MLPIRHRWMTTLGIIKSLGAKRRGARDRPESRPDAAGGAAEIKRGGSRFPSSPGDGSRIAVTLPRRPALPIETIDGDAEAAYPDSPAKDRRGSRRERIQSNSQPFRREYRPRLPGWLRCSIIFARICAISPGDFIGASPVGVR